MAQESQFDCIVVGGGHAGSCAALSAVQHGCKRVLILDKAPHQHAGGNGFFTAGAMRTVHGGLADLLPIVSNVTPEVAATIDMDPYTPADFTGDIQRLSAHRSHAALVDALVGGSRDAVEWLAKDVRVPFVLSFNRQAYAVDGRQKFWGGMVLSVVEGGKGLIAAHQRRLKEAGVEVWHESRVSELIVEEGAIAGVRVERDGKTMILHSHSVILACGGFESSPELRAKYLGDEWRRARVRGIPYNTGDGLSLGTAVGAALRGDFSRTGCHSTCWDADAPLDRGDRILSNQFTKSGYPLGLMLNVHGDRFVDEGEDFRNYTYAKFGRAILHQAGGVAFQVYDARVTPYLRVEEYGNNVVRKVYASTLPELAQKLSLEGLERPDQFVDTIEKYNLGVTVGSQAGQQQSPTTPPRSWNPAVKDGLSTSGVSPPKSNWALPIDSPPFLAVKVACGITFTFGGLAIDHKTAAVLREDKDNSSPINGLFCAGELVGGLFYGNYPGGSGLTAGAVFGRKAGEAAAALALSHVKVA